MHRPAFLCPNSYKRSKLIWSNSSSRDHSFMAHCAMIIPPNNDYRKLKPRWQFLDRLWMDFSQYCEFDIWSNRNFSLVASYSPTHSWWSIETEIFKRLMLFIPYVLLCTQSGFPCPSPSWSDQTTAVHYQGGRRELQRADIGWIGDFSISESFWVQFDGKEMKPVTPKRDENLPLKAQFVRWTGSGFPGHDSYS
jgi:hypothetical protein